MRYLLEIAAAVAAKKRDNGIRQTAQAQKAEIEAEIATLSDNNVDEILRRLFPAGVPVGSVFFDSLQDFQHHIGYGPAFYNLGGRLWAAAYNSLSKREQGALLNALFEGKGRGVWRAIFFLPEFCSRVDIDPEFAAGWFYRFADKVKDDMAKWDFFNGVAAYATHFPKSGLMVFEVYMTQELDELRLHLAGLLLGTIRTQAVVGSFDRNITDRWDRRLRQSQSIKFRLVYDKSLPLSFDGGATTLPALKRQLTRMLGGSPEEVSEAFNTVWRCLRGKLADETLMRFGLRWYSKNVSSKLPDAAKHHVVSTIWYFSTPGKQGTAIQGSKADDLLVAIQPIPAANRGTWDYVEQYLVQRLRQDPRGFEDVLGRLVDANPKGLLAQFQSEVFGYLRSEICKAKEQGFLTRWLLSVGKNKREIGRAIFRSAESVTFSEKAISHAEETELEVALLESIRQPLLAQKTSAYLLALEPAFRKVSPALKEKFKKEMTMQAINYPGACLDAWKKVEKPSDLLRAVIADAEGYFERLRVVKDSPAVAFSFPGCKEAAEKEAREFSTRVSREAQEKSVFAKLAKSVQVIYGSRWAVMTEGKLSQPTGFHEFSESMEFPRLEGIDPEGMAKRRLQVATELKEM